ncbi:MAG: hypothetical protein RH859_06155 [Longimicrobiales bacterium]
MTPATARRILLGPQPDGATLARAARTVAPDGRAAVITAGWQEWEDDDEALRVGLGSDTVNLRLYHRALDIWSGDPELARAHTRLGEQIRLLRRAYNVRLARAMEAWLALEELEGDPAVLDVERAEALAAVQALDRHHAVRLEALRATYYEAYDPLVRPAVARNREELQRILEGVEVVVVAGGHLPALINRIRLMGVDTLLGSTAVVAASAGAMALAPRVVFFHDAPPWGPGHAELGEVGLGLVPDIVALPDPSTRLRLDDAPRMARMARRFAPDTCLLLDPDETARWDGRWQGGTARHLTATGTAEPWSGAA